VEAVHAHQYLLRSLLIIITRSAVLYVVGAQSSASSNKRAEEINWTPFKDSRSKTDRHRR